MIIDVGILILILALAACAVGAVNVWANNQRAKREAIENDRVQRQLDGFNRHKQ